MLFLNSQFRLEKQDSFQKEALWNHWYLASVNWGSTVLVWRPNIKLTHRLLPTRASPNSFSSNKPLTPPKTTKSTKSTKPTIPHTCFTNSLSRMKISKQSPMDITGHRRNRVHSSYRSQCWANGARTYLYVLLVRSKLYLGVLRATDHLDSYLWLNAWPCLYAPNTRGQSEEASEIGTTDEKGGGEKVDAPHLLPSGRAQNSPEHDSRGSTGQWFTWLYYIQTSLLERDRRY